MCKQCVTFAQNKRSNVWQRAHLCEIVAVRIAQLVHASRHAVAHNMCNVVVLSGCEPLKWHFCRVLWHSFAGKCQCGIMSTIQMSTTLQTRNKYQSKCIITGLKSRTNVFVKLINRLRYDMAKMWTIVLQKSVRLLWPPLCVYVM